MTYDVASAALNLKSVPDVLNSADQIISYEPAMVGWGGVSRDTLSRYKIVDQKLTVNEELHLNSPKEIFDDLRKRTELLRKNPNDSERKQDVIDAASRAITYLDHMKDQTPAQVIEDLAKGNRNSHYFKIHCEEEILKIHAKLEEGCDAF